MPDFGKVDDSKLTPLAVYRGEDEDETQEVHHLAERATTFIESFSWCKGVRDVLVGDVTVGKVLSVFLCSIVPSTDGVDDLLWTIVGDLPPGYIAVSDDTANPASALDAYLGEIEQWISAAREGRAIDDLMPVLTADGGGEIPPTRANAEQLEQRLRFIDDEILTNYRGDLAR